MVIFKFLWWIKVGQKSTHRTTQLIGLPTQIKNQNKSMKWKSTKVLDNDEEVHPHTDLEISDSFFQKSD